MEAGFENPCSRWLCSLRSCGLSEAGADGAGWVVGIRCKWLCSLSESGLGRPMGRTGWLGSRSEWVCSLKTGGWAFQVVDRAGLVFRGPVESGFVPSRALDSRLGTGGGRGRSRPEWVCLFYCRAGGFRLKVGLFGQKCRDGGPIGFRCAFQNGFVQPGMAAMRAPMPTLQPGTKELEHRRRLAGCGSAVKELRMDACSGCPIRSTGFEASRA